MLGELVVQTSFIAFKSNSKWHEELIRVLGFVATFDIGIRDGIRASLSRGYISCWEITLESGARNRLPLRGQYGGRWECW